MQYKVLALDLDGTLTNSDKIITPRTKAALQAAAQKGVCIVLASGRPTVGIEPLAKELELGKYGGCILSYNGGKIIDCKTGHVLVQHAFPPDLIKPPAGCPFVDRCDKAMKICKMKMPPERKLSDTHAVCCWLTEKPASGKEGE